MTCTTGSKSPWDFALALYSSPGVEETALYLQNSHGANVNILLWAAWLETQAIALTPDLLRSAESTIAAWDRQVVQVLRELRQRLKGDEAELAKELRISVKAAELLAERQCLLLLEGVAAAPGTEAVRAGQNVDFYARNLNGVADVEAIRRAIASLSIAKP